MGIGLKPAFLVGTQAEKGSSVITIYQANKCHYNSNQLIPDLIDFSPRVELNLQTLIQLLSDSPRVYILVIPLTFRPPKEGGRSFSRVDNSFQASKSSICTLFQSRPSSYQGNVVCLLCVSLNQKVTSGEPNKFFVCSFFRRLNFHVEVLSISIYSETTFF